MTSKPTLHLISMQITLQTRLKETLKHACESWLSSWQHRLASHCLWYDVLADSLIIDLVDIFSCAVALRTQQ